MQPLCRARLGLVGQLQQGLGGEGVQEGGVELSHLESHQRLTVVNEKGGASYVFSETRVGKDNNNGVGQDMGNV